MAIMMMERHNQEAPPADSRSGLGFTLGLILGAAAGGIFSLTVSSGRPTPDLWSALDLGLKLEQIRDLKTAEVGE